MSNYHGGSIVEIKLNTTHTSVNWWMDGGSHFLSRCMMSGVGGYCVALDYYGLVKSVLISHVHMHESNGMF